MVIKNPRFKPGVFVNQVGNRNQKPRLRGVLDFYGEGARSVYVVVSPVFAPVCYWQEYPFGRSICITLCIANSSFLPLFQPCTGRKFRVLYYLFNIAINKILMYTMYYKGAGNN